LVIDKAGGIRAARSLPLGQQIATEEILQVLERLK
jgi:hypothetical protein